MRCPVCHTDAIPGINSCVVCGTTLSAGSVPGIRVSGLPTPAEIAEREINYSAHRARMQRVTEARALEIAGDTERAIAIYEEMVRGGYKYPDVFKRLTIVYKKLKRHADEERIVRIALSRLGEYVNGWFMLRLATIIAKQKKEAARRSDSPL